jgi:hypothetical protein
MRNIHITINWLMRIDGFLFNHHLKIQEEENPEDPGKGQVIYSDDEMPSE